MKRILILLQLFFISIIVFGESKYFPVGTTWTEVTSKYGSFGRDTSTYVVKEEMPIDGVIYNVVYRNDEPEPYCLLREEGSLVYMTNIVAPFEDEGLLYDFDWWEGKEYVTDVIYSGGEKFCEVIEKIDEMVLEDGQTYQIWAPEDFFGDFIICGVGATNGIFRYSEPAVTGGAQTSLLEFTRDVLVYNKENNTNGLKDVNMVTRQKTRSIRLKRNTIGGYDLQMQNADGTWQMVW
ncbi:MAG: hypothetical protein IKX25_05355 [Bacteroidales bacterium]|nr:hypothetical protein [Bacteroidales bacterium]